MKNDNINSEHELLSQGSRIYDAQYNQQNSQPIIGSREHNVDLKPPKNAVPLAPPLYRDREILQKFNTANRNSKRVQALKIGLPLIGGSFTALFVGIALATQHISAGFGITAIDLTDGQVVMDKPRLNGITSNDSAYEIVADRALQDLDDSKKVIMEEIDATLALANGNMVSVQANHGNFDIEIEELTLTDNINVHMSAGYEAVLQQATIDINEGTVQSSEPVFIKTDIGEISANNVFIRDNGDVIFFEDRVRLTIRAEKIRSQP